MRAPASHFIVIFAFATLAVAQTRSVPDPGVITTRQSITPAGTPTVFDGRVYGVAFGASAAELWVSNASKLYRLDWNANRVTEPIPLQGAPGLQAIQFDASANRALIAVAVRMAHGPAQVGLFAGRDLIAGGLGTYIAGAIAANEKIAAVPLTHDNQLAVIDLAARSFIAKIPTGIAPFAAVISRDSKTAFVSNWGGRKPKPGDLTATAGQEPNADQVVVDSRGVASTGTVTRIDLTAQKPTATIAVGLHPTALAWDETNHRLYVANGNSDSISVIDTATLAVRTIAIAPFNVKAAGIAPTALALSADRRTLYAACGGISAIAVLDAGSGRLRGLIPTAWYPNHLAVSADGKWIAVSALLGAGSGWRDAPSKRYVHADRGSVAVVPIPNDAQLASYTAAVAANNRLQLAGSPQTHTDAVPAAKAAPIPARSGDPSLIEHVVYIIKENRTYDQVFGDIAKANGDASLVMFGEKVTPNQHTLARDFVVFDNFYATGGNSADGHQWVTQANETDYCLWPGYAGRSYPFDGSDPIAYSKNGFLWDYALARGKSVRIYGEYSGLQREPPAKRHDYLLRWRNGDDFTHEWTAKAPIAALNKILAANYPAYSTSIPDVIRAQIFLADLKRMEQSGSMPNLTLIQLPSNHTNGTDPGVSTPQAMVADNDFALGKIVEGLSKSKFWPKMAIFIVEDDAQNGVDHVDGHRTVALAVSPYIRRGTVDSTFYSTQSMVKTIELILGLPTMSIFDLIAEDMRFSFSAEADLTPFAAVQPATSLYDENPRAVALNGDQRRAAVDSSKMRWEIPDAAPTERLNRILWHSIKGWDVAYPGAHHAVFAPLSIDIADDDRK